MILARASRLYAFAVTLCLSVAACGDGSPTTGEIPRGPEPSDNAIGFDQVVTGTVRNGDTVNVRFRPGTAGDFVITVSTPDETLFASVTEEATGAHVGLTGAYHSGPGEAGGTWPVRADGSGVYRISVFAPNASPGGTFRLKAVRYNTGPETVAVEITPGTMVETELLDYDTDVDQFTFTGPPTGSVVVTSQQTGTGRGAIRGLLGEEGGLFNTFVTPGGMNATTAVYTTYPITVTPGKRYKLQITAQQQFPSYLSYSGGYRIGVMPVNPGPNRTPTIRTDRAD
jgi:hypothetical protein